MTPVLDLMKGRYVIYSLLADLFSQAPAIDKLQKVHAISNTLAENMELDRHTLFFQGLEKLNAWFEQHAGRFTDDSISVDLAREFTGLFSIGNYSIPDNASAYLSRQKITKREPWERVRHFYKEQGFFTPVKQQMLDDSIAMELTFLSIMAEKASVADLEDTLTANIETQKTFIEEHLKIWLDVFCAAIREKGKEDGLYASLSLLLEGFTDIDHELLSALSEK